MCSSNVIVDICGGTGRHGSDLERLLNRICNPLIF
jgi:hypothetical protein